MFGDVSRMAALVAAILTAGISFAGDDVLYWMVDGDVPVERWNGNTTVRGLYDEWAAGAAEGSAFAARIRVTGGNIQDGQDVFLDLYIPGYGVDVGGGEYGVEFSSAGGYWGAGVPTGNQSPSGDYSAGTPEYCFIVELGNVDSSDNWTTVATSASASYTSLAAYIHETFDINPSAMAVWMPNSFATPIPEPSSGLLTLLGLALISLRRKKFKWRATAKPSFPG